MSEDAKQAEPVDIHVGSVIRRRRRELRMGQDELAMALRLTPQQIQKYETAASRVSASKLFLIARVLKTPVAYFFADIEDLAFDGVADEVEASVSSFIKSGDGRELALVFPKIGDTAVRKSFLNLARAMAHANQTSKLADT